MDLSKETEAKISQLQMLEQNLQNFLIQKQNFQAQLAEIKSALDEIGDAETCYKIVGGIMILSEKEKLKNDLKSKQEMIELRITTLEKQENKMKEKAQAMQSEVMKEMNLKE